jgi:acetyl/propionyl-CoA carboxylase alpha subunit
MIMEIRLFPSIVVVAVAVLFLALKASPLSAAEMTSPSLVFDEKTYTAEVEKAHQKLHMLFGQAFDKRLPGGERKKAQREFLKISQELIKKMHSRVMTMNVKEGAALSHTDILTSTHLLLMVTDMLTTIQQETCADPTRLSSTE